jgi:predicted ATP-grasp superfamily ATP-dependent carboligase
VRAATSEHVAATPRAAAELPVIVLGGHVTALGVLRSLGPRGIETHLLADPGDYAGASRWARPLHDCPPESPDPAPLAAFLAGLRLDRALLLPCSDDWTRAVAALPSDVRERFPSPLAPLETLEKFLDKERFAALVEEVGVPHPRTSMLLRDASDPLAGFEFETDGARLFLKPPDSQQFVRHFGVKAFSVEGEADAQARLEEIWNAGIESMLLQEYVPGPASSHYFIDGFVAADGRTIARLARRRLRMYPRDFGNSTYHVTVPLAEVAEALEHLDRLFSRTSFRGIFSAEFKRDERDGELKILEMNVRPWWYVHFASTCGVDVCELAHREARGLPLEPSDAYTIGASCVLLGADLRAFLDQRGPDGVGLLRWLGGWVGATRVVFSTRDPLPALFHVKEVGARWLRRRMGERRGAQTST